VRVREHAPIASDEDRVARHAVELEVRRRLARGVLDAEREEGEPAA
jgi:hypothetical protein